MIALGNITTANGKSRLNHLDRGTAVADDKTWDNQLLSSFKFEDDQLVCIPGAFHGRVPDAMWPDEDWRSS